MAGPVHDLCGLLVRQRDHAEAKSDLRRSEPDRIDRLAQKERAKDRYKHGPVKLVLVHVDGP